MKSLPLLLMVLMFAGWSEAGRACKSKHKLFIKTVQGEEQKWASHLISLIDLKVLKNEGCVRDFCVTYSVSKSSNKNTHFAEFEVQT